jgi:hypothetical protein
VPPEPYVTSQQTTLLNHLRVLSAEELGVPEDVFARIDLNGDGQAERKELNAARQIARIYEGIGPLQPDNDDEENDNIDVNV